MSSARVSLSVALLLVLCLLAGCATPLGPVSLESVTPASATIGETTRITLRGSGFYLQDSGGEPRLDGVDIRVCGASLTDLQYGELERQSVAIAPGGATMVFVCGFISGLLGQDAVAGTSDVVVTVPMTGNATITGAFECLEPLPPEPEEPDEPAEPEPLNPAIAIEPPGAELLVGESRQFTATVQDLENEAVAWSVTGVGMVEDPAANPVTYKSDVPGEATLTATSVTNPEVSASVQLSVAYPGLSVAIEPGSGTMYPEQQQTYVATVDGWSDTSVTWQVNGDPTEPATIDGNELTFRSTVDDAGSEFTLTATSVANPTESASVTVTVVAYPITVSTTAVTLAPGESIELTASSMDPGDFDYEWSVTGGSLSDTNGSTVTYTAPVHFDDAAEVSVSVTSPGDPTGATVDVTVETRLEAKEVTLSPSCPRQLMIGSMPEAWYMLGADDDCGADTFAMTWSLTDVQDGHALVGKLDPSAHGVLQPDGSLFIATTTSECAADEFGLYDWNRQVDFMLRECYGVDSGPYNIVDMQPVTDSRSLVLAQIGPGSHGRSYDLMYVSHPSDRVTVYFTRASTTDSFVALDLLYKDGLAIVAGRVGNATVLERFEIDDDDFWIEQISSFRVDGPGSLAPTVVAVDNNGDIVLATIAVDEPGGDRIMRLFKLKGATGVLIWHVDLGPTGNRGVTGIATGDDGTIYVAGQSQGAGQASELIVAAVDSDGGQLWREQFTDPDDLGMTASTELLFWDDDTLIVGGYEGLDSQVDDSFVLKLRLD